MTNSLGPKIRSFEITPREIYLSRRHFMGGALATGAALAASTALSAASPTSLSFSQNAFPKPSDAMPENLQQSRGPSRLVAKSQSQRQ